MTHTVGIIGGAPTGTLGLERLVAMLAASPLEEPVEIHIFNRSAGFGAGEIYDPEQPDYLLTNARSEVLGMWSPEEPPAVTADSFSLFEWCDRRCEPPMPVAADEHAPRALVGRYLAAGFEAIAENLPAGVTLHRHIGDVLDVLPNDGRYRVVYRAQCSGGSEVDGSEICIECDKLLLATGHTRHRPTWEETKYAEFAERSARCAFVFDVYPVDEMQRHVPAGSTVAVKGLSLTFVDAVLAMTEGMGGGFEREASGRLRYLASGGEPKRILPFSRSGLPTRPRACDVTEHSHELVFITREAHEALRQTSPDGRIDLVRDVWPLFVQEMEWAYYQGLMKGTSDEDRLHACGDDYPAIQSLIGDFHRRRASVRRFDVDRLFDPIGTKVFESGAAFQAFVESQLRRENEKARQGAAGNAEKAAVEIWRFYQRLLLPFASFGGLTPASHRRLHTEIWPRMQHLAHGPPLENMEKILALAEAGIVDFGVALGPEVILCGETGAFRVRCQRTYNETVAEILLDARVPWFSLERDVSPLYRNLKRRGLVRSFENAWPGDASYRPGAIDSTEDSSVVGAEGEVNPDVSVIGVPTEGCIYNGSPLTRTRSSLAGVWAAKVVDQWQRKELSGRS